MIGRLKFPKTSFSTRVAKKMPIFFRKKVISRDYELILKHFSIEKNLITARLAEKLAK